MLESIQTWNLDELLQVLNAREEYELGFQIQVNLG
jgi:hypothetical protein